MPPAGLSAGRGIELVLFDLDGTVIDSAPDLAGTVNEMRRVRGLHAIPLEVLRPHVGSGARGMVGAAFGLRPGDAGYAELRAEFLRLYPQRMLDQTRVFEAVQGVLGALDAQGLRWGIVTNKAMSMAGPIAEALGLAKRAAVLIGGDSTAHAKPHPEPLLEAARRCGVAPTRCIYVGDDARDMQAAHACGMTGLAAAWGYLGTATPIETWGADAVLQQPAELLHWLQLA